ncbi:1328_t:CDS:2, partial [Racocetra persica]
MRDVYAEAFARKQKDGINKATFAAPYTIYFPPSLWGSLTEEQKNHPQTAELTLREDVKLDPIRGEKDSNTKKDNNALFYGTGGTGKSISVEKLAYEADKYPLVIVKGLALTPKLPDQKYEGGEVRYIFFIDEADQISENSFAKESTGLTFLKECMGSDNYKLNEKKFIANNPGAEYEPEKDEENTEEQEDEDNEPADKKLEHFDGKFETPRNPKVEE